MAYVRGIRGATTADGNTKEAIVKATKELLVRLIKDNDVDVDDLAAAYFTTTEDLNAEFPAQAARQLGWEYVALMNGHEMKVPRTLAQCIRVMLLVNTNKAPRDLANVYIKGASNLRDRGMEEV
jgi:chorismate mutase